MEHVFWYNSIPGHKTASILHSRQLLCHARNFLSIKVLDFALERNEDSIKF